MDNFVLRMPALYSPTYAKQCAPLVTINPVFAPSPALEMPPPDKLYPGRRGYMPDIDSDVSTVTFERELLQRTGSFDALSADDSELELAVSQLRIFHSEREGRQLTGAWYQAAEIDQLRDRPRPFSYLDPLGAPDYPRHDDRERREGRDGREGHEGRDRRGGHGGNGRHVRHGRQERLDWPPLKTHRQQLELEYLQGGREEPRERQERHHGRPEKHHERHERHHVSPERHHERRHEKHHGRQQERHERHQDRHKERNGQMEYHDWQDRYERHEVMQEHVEDRRERDGRLERREPARPDSDTSAYDIPPRVLRPTKPMTSSSWRLEAPVLQLPPPQENIYETPRQAWPPSRRSPSPVYADLEPRRGGVPRSSTGQRAPPERGRPTEPPPPPPVQESEYVTVLAHSESSTSEAPAAICQESETSSGEEEEREDTTTTDGTPGREALKDGSELWAGNEVRRLPPERQRRQQQKENGRSSERRRDRREQSPKRRQQSPEPDREWEERSRRRALLGARSRLLSSLRRAAPRSRSAGPVPTSSRTRQSGHTPLQRAAAEGHLQVVQQLIQQGVTVDHQDEVNGNTALHEAAWKGYSQSVDTLLKARANMYLRNRGGFTALHLACQNGHNQTCRLLLLAGCSPDIRNSYGDTPLHTSARYGHAGVMRILISGDASLSEQNKNGDTALHIAAAMGRRKLTRILLDGGVDYNLRNKQEESALQIALRKEHVEIVEMIRNPPEVTRLSTKREEKRAKPESGSSSKEGSGKHIDKKKKSSKVHFEPKKSSKAKKPNPKWSPYGCFYPPDMAEFPQPRLDTLPKDPLGKGEQYYLDLSGNIRKGPVGEGYTCYCAPFFRHVEDKLDKDKHELIHHIDLTHGKLDKKIASLEKRTRTQLTGINELMRERFSRERLECADRAERVALRTRAELERRQGYQIRGVKDDLTAYLEGKFNQLGVREAGGRRGSARELHKSRSEELLTDLSGDDELASNASDASEGGGRGKEGGLRVLERPSEYPPLRSAGSLSDLRRRFEQEDSTETAPSEPAAASPRRHPLPLRPADAYDGYGARPKHAVLEVRNAHLRGAGCVGEPWPGARVPPGYVGYPAGATDPDNQYTGGLGFNNPGYVQYEPLTAGAPGAVRPPPGRQFRPLELEEPADQHNDSGYSTKIYGSSQGPSPALSGVPEDESHLNTSTSSQLLHRSQQPSPSQPGAALSLNQSHSSQSPSPSQASPMGPPPPGQTSLHSGQASIHSGHSGLHGAQNGHHGQPNGLPNGHHGPPNGHHGVPNSHHGPPNGHHGVPNGLHGPPNGLHGAPNGHHGPPNGLPPSLSGLPRGPHGMHGGPPGGRMALGPRIQALQSHLTRITEDMHGLEQSLEQPGIKSSLV